MSARRQIRNLDLLLAVIIVLMAAAPFYAVIYLAEVH